MLLQVPLLLPQMCLRLLFIPGVLRTNGLPFCFVSLQYVVINFMREKLEWVFYTCLQSAFSVLVGSLILYLCSQSPILTMYKIKKIDRLLRRMNVNKVALSERAWIEMNRALWLPNYFRMVLNVLRLQ